jgi:hypothetical protein
VIAVQVRDEDRLQTRQFQTGVQQPNLGAFSTIEQEQFPAALNRSRRKMAIGGGEGGSDSKGNDFDHR